VGAGGVVPVEAGVAAGVAVDEVEETELDGDTGSAAVGAECDVVGKDAALGASADVVMALSGFSR
jgi:hypothetical protein